MKYPAEDLVRSDGFASALDAAAVGLADSMVEGSALRDALADPIVRALMAADGIDPQQFEGMIRQMGEKLANRGMAAARRCSW